MNKKGQEAPELEVPKHVVMWILLVALFFILLTFLGFNIIRPWLS